MSPGVISHRLATSAACQVELQSNHYPKPQGIIVHDNYSWRITLLFLCTVVSSAIDVWLKKGDQPRSQGNKILI